MHNRDTMRSQMGGKQFQAQIHDARASHKQLWQAGWQRDRRILLLGEYGSTRGCAPHCRPLDSAVLWVAAKHSGSETGSLGVTVRQEQPVLAYDLALLCEVLRIIWGTTYMGNPYQFSPRSVSHGLCLLPGRGKG